MEERDYPSSTGFLLGNCIPTNSYVQCDLCSLPLCQGKQEGDSSVFQGDNADTEVFNTTIHRVRGGHWRKFWSALEMLFQRHIESLQQLPSQTS